MSQEKIKPELSGSKATPNHPRDIADLAALVVGHSTSHEPGHEDGTVIIFVWRYPKILPHLPHRAGNNWLALRSRRFKRV
jgi:hypothetical protein